MISINLSFTFSDAMTASQRVADVTTAPIAGPLAAAMIWTRLRAFLMVLKDMFTLTYKFGNILLLQCFL